MSIIAIVVCSGCGGDGMTDGCADCSTGSDGGSVSNGPVPSNVLRRNVVGDTTNYSVVGTYSQVGGAQRVATTGTANEIFNPTTVGGRVGLIDVRSITLTINGSPVTFTDSYAIDSSQSTLGISDAGFIQSVASGAVTYPLNVDTTTILQGTEVLANGVSVSFHYAVIGVNTVSIPTGTYDCWLVREGMEYSDGNKIEVEMNYSPDLAAALNAHIYRSFPSGLSLSLQLTTTQLVTKSLRP